MRKSLTRNLVVEIIVAATLCLLLWMVTRVQPNGELSGAGYQLSLLLQDAENYVVGLISAPESQGLGLLQTRTKYETFMYSGFCGLGNIANVYVQNSSALSYFVVIPAFLIIIFAYNKAGPDEFSRPARAIFSATLIAMIVVVTFKVIEVQGIQSSIVTLPIDDFQIENFDYRCEAHIGGQDEELGAAPLSLFLGNLSAFLSEVRLYLLGLVLWVIGKEHADIRRMQRAAAATPGEGEGND